MTETAIMSANMNPNNNNNKFKFKSQSLSSCRLHLQRINPLSLLTYSIYFLIISTSNFSNCASSKTEGHLRKLGAHREPLGVTWSGKFPSPGNFYSSFVDPGKPTIMKAALEQVDHPGLSKWTDNFLSDKFGSETVKVERSKIEDRDVKEKWISLREFLRSYQSEDTYLVHSLKDNMKELALIPNTLHCGGFQNVIQESVLWMGSHTTSSVLHRDPVDNLLCVLHGRKYVVLIDKAYKDDVEESGFDELRGFSAVNPQEVDFDKFPRLAHVNWHEANLAKGDCLYIPQGWYHQVTSSGYRHVSVNIWFSHLWWFNDTDCHYDVSVYKPLEPVSTFGFASPNEAYRSKLLSRFKNKGILTRYLFRDNLPSNPTQERANEFFDAINDFPDGALAWGELYTFDIDKILPQFWDLFDLPGSEVTPREMDEEKNGYGHQNTLDGDSDTDSSSGANSKHTKGEKGEMDTPLPDAVSEDTPSLPDSSVHHPVHEFNTHQHWEGQVDDEDDNGNADTVESLDGFCTEESCKEDTSETEAYRQFTQLSDTGTASAHHLDHSDSDNDATDDEESQNIKDEL